MVEKRDRGRGREIQLGRGKAAKWINYEGEDGIVLRNGV